MSLAAHDQFVVQLHNTRHPQDMSQLSYLDDPPFDDNVTNYDREHVNLYLRLLDAEAQRASWHDVTKIVFGIDPASDYGRARRVYENHLTRARLLAARGYRDLVSHKRVTPG